MKRKGYNAADNSARGYDVGIRAIRLEGVKAGRFLPLPDRPDEIKASPIVDDVRRIGPALMYRGDCRRIVALLENIDACITDPPYELGFMGKGWDSSGVAAEWQTWGAVRIALKPGAHLLAFAGSRTYHRIAGAIDDAGFEVRDLIAWLYGSGFPKSYDVAKGIDKIDTVGPRRERALRFTEWMRSTGITGKKINAVTKSSMASHYLTDGEQPEIPTADMFDKLRPHLPPVPQDIEDLVASRTVESENLKRRPIIGQHEKPSHAAAWRAGLGHGEVGQIGHNSAAFSDDAKKWEDWGTALKPALEPVCFARKPLSEGTIAANVLRWATGAINIGATRVGDRERPKVTDARRDTSATYGAIDNAGGKLLPDARWPANVTHDGSFEVFEAFPPSARDAMRFFYSAKADRDERDFGLDALPKRARPTMGSGIGGQPDQQRANNRNIHPTVKPVDLMRWLCRLVTPPRGTVLDPFMGSGTTGIAAVREGFGFIGVEQDADYFDIACRRVEAAVRLLELQPDIVREMQRARTSVDDQGELL